MLNRIFSRSVKGARASHRRVAPAAHTVKPRRSYRPGVHKVPRAAAAANGRTRNAARTASTIRKNKRNRAIMAASNSLPGSMEQQARVMRRGAQAAVAGTAIAYGVGGALRHGQAIDPPNGYNSGSYRF